MGLLKGTSVGGVNTVTLDTKVVKLSGLLPGTATGDAVTYEQLSGSFDPVFDDLTADTITVGSIVLQNATNANTLTIQSGVTSASYSLTLPTAQGSANTVLTNNGSGVLSWTAPSSGITVGTTTITSGTSNRILYQSAGGVVTQKANFTMDAVASGVLDVPIGYAINGTQILKQSTAAGYLFLGSSTPFTYTNSGSTIIGNSAGLSNTGSQNVFLGLGAGVASGTASGCTFLGYTNLTASTANVIGSIFIGYEAAVTASHQGVLGGNNSTGYVDNWYYNGVTHTAPYGVNIRASGGSGSNINGADLSFYAGLPTGDGSNVAAGRNGIMSFWTGDAGASGTTLRSATEKIRISQKGNFLIGGTTENTSATKALVLANGTEASALLANAICIQSQDTSAGLASLSIYVEDTVQAVAAEVLSNYLRVRINGVEYKLAIIA